MQLKHQALQSGGDAAATPPASVNGAVTGPTISGCALSAGESQLTLKFNGSLLGGEPLQLRPFDANETGGESPAVDPRTELKIHLVLSLLRSR